MSVETCISAIASSRNTIRNKLVELGIAESDDKLDELATAIESIIDQGAVSITVKEGDTYTIPKGYHNGKGTVSGGGNTLQAKTATPTKNQQNIAPDSGYYGLSDVTINAIPEAYQDVSSVTAVARDVLSGKVIVTADGTVTAGKMVDNGAYYKTADATNNIYPIPEGYHNGSGTFRLNLEVKRVTPTGSEQEVTATSGRVIHKVIVDAIPAKYKDVSGVTATAANVLDGSYFVTSAGLVEGTMPDMGTVTATIDGLTTTSYTIPNGKHSGSGKVSLTSDIESALAAI